MVPSPDPHCKHQLVYDRLNYSVLSPPPYKRIFWKYNQADLNGIRESVRLTNWQDLLGNGDPSEMVGKFNKAFLGIIKSNIPNKIANVSTKDAPWITPVVKTALRKNQRTYKRWKANGSDQRTRYVVNRVKIETNRIIGTAKSNYMSDLERKVSDPTGGKKVFWGAFNNLINKKKITIIYPLFYNGT